MIDIEKMNALYDVIERAIEQCGGADNFLKEYTHTPLIPPLIADYIL